MHETDSDSDYYQPSSPFPNFPTKPQSQPPPPPQPQLTNLHEAATYLNHELASFGFPSPLNFTTISTDPKTKHAVNEILNCVFALIQQRQKDSDYKTETECRIGNLQNEANIATDTIAKLKNRLEASEREVNGLCARLSSTEVSLKEQEKSNRSLKDEIKFVKSNMQFAKCQYAHELRKRETEYARLKDRLQKSINDKLKSSKVGLKLISPLTNGSSGIHSARPRNKDEEMYKMVLANYESREKEVMVENDLLRSALSELYQTAKCCIRDARVQEKGDDLEDGDAVDVEKSNAKVPKLHMPFSAVRQSVVDEIRELLADLAREWGNRPALQAARDKLRCEAMENDLIVEMKNKSKEDERIIAEQFRLLNLVVDPDDGESNPQNFWLKKKPRRRRRRVVLDNSEPEEKSFEEEEEEEEEEWTESELQNERQVIRQLRRELDEERKRFTEAAIRMGKERRALQDERVAWEENKRAFHTALMLEQLPGTPMTNIPRSRNPHDTRTTPSTILSSQHRNPVHHDNTATPTRSRKETIPRVLSRRAEVSENEVSEFKPSLGRGSTPHVWKQRDAEVTFGSPLAIVVESDTLASKRSVVCERRSGGRRWREKENRVPGK